MPDDQRIANLFLDERTVVRRSAQVEHERRVAIFDLLEDNRFVPTGGFSGPYTLHLSIRGNRLVFDVRDEADGPMTTFRMGLGPFRSVIRDYFVVCDSYYGAIKMASRERIEAIDVGRRSLHDEGAELLRQRLAGKAEIDTDTARRMFTLICVLHIRNTSDAGGL